MPVDPFPKDGLAISGGVPLEPIETVKPTVARMGADGGDAARASSIASRTETIAGRASDGALATSDHPEQRRTAAGPPRVVVSRASGDEPGSTVSYVEAVRQYPPGPDDKGCGLETLVSGWLHHRDGKLIEARHNCAAS